MDTESLPIRLIICVDDTWCTPDGPHGRHHENTSNVYRIYSSAKVGDCIDATGRRFFQKKRYFPGIGSKENLALFSRLHIGIFGKDSIKQICEVYEYCCSQTYQAHSDTEIWFFGFSRGAYVVRAVAGLLHYIRALTSAGTPDFKEDYANALRRYEDLQSRSKFQATIRGP
jgi:uncharacterized protein (DUF2235 family)